jgi:hypothetical protein
VASKTSHPGITEKVTSRRSCGGLLSCLCARFRVAASRTDPDRLLRPISSVPRADVVRMLLCSNPLAAMRKHQ